MEHYLGEKLKKLRESRGWTQADLAKRLNKAVSTISGYESDPPFTFLTRRTAQMDELNPTVREQEIYEEMELTPEMIKSIRTLCATCLRHFVEAKAFKIALVPSADRSMDTCTVCQTRRGHDYVVMHR